MKYPHVIQHDEKDCGAACLSMISEYYGLRLSLSRFRDIVGVDAFGSNIYGIIKGASKIGLSAKALEGSINELLEEIEKGRVKLPFIARIINEELYEHFIVIYELKDKEVVVGDPSKEKITKIPIDKFINQWQYQIIIFEPEQTFKKNNERKKNFAKFWKPILNQKKILIVVFVVSLIISGIGICSASIFGHIVDNVIEVNNEDNKSAVIQQIDEKQIINKKESSFLNRIREKVEIICDNLESICVITILLYILQALLQGFRGYILAIMTKNIDISLSLEYYEHLVDLPIGFFGTRKTGELMSRFSDVSNIRDAISTATLTIMLDTVMAVVMGVYLFVLNSKLFLITFIIIIVYAMIILWFKNPIKKINREVMEKNAYVTAYLKESIDGIETIKAYKYEKNSKNRTRNLFIEYVNKVVNGTIIYTVLNVLVGMIESIGLVVLLWAGAYLCIQDIITVGSLITFYYLLSYFLDPIKNLIELQPSLQSAFVAAERLNDVLDVPVENNLKENVNNLRGNISFENVCFRYGNRNLVLKNINVKIPQGSKIAFIGESGCGKTTLAKLLMNFYFPEKGTIKIGGKKIIEYSPQSIRKHIAYVPQSVFLLSDTIYNNLRIGNKDITNEEIEEICRLCLADEFIQKLPFGYNTMLEENGNNLSGGQKQKLSIARALLKKPDILIIDEATSNLDAIAERSLEKIINKLSVDITVIVIAHRLWTVQNCDCIYVMQNGEIKEEGSHIELLKKKGIYANYWKNQF